MSISEAPRLLKAESLRGLGAKIAFNYDDLRQRCDEYIEKVRQQAQQLITEAHAEAETIRSQAYEEGLAAGQREGLQQAQAEIDARVNQLADQKAADKLSTLYPAMQQAAEQLAADHDRWLTHWEASAVRLAAAIAERILRREIERKPELTAEVLREALQLAAGSSQIKLRLNPADVELLDQRIAEIVERISPGGTATIVADAQISRGGCLVETQHGLIDGRLETQLERITAELLDQETGTEA